ncbi:Uu.00g030840.m01.CDS01 [Anthostomella pinea]|uniref:Uu.00g030840.m01.CDS01 n=1 Tax=Anthostomella pinea TaxID=933095 RepID=A0AAI8V9E3_9PEZI|nr:Uu.00g030840.m01.CDS01 [Anthostomella pinea]
MNELLDYEFHDESRQPAPTKPYVPVRDRSQPSISQQVQHDAQGPYVMRRDGLGWYRHRPLEVAMASSVLFDRAKAEKGTKDSITTLFKLDRVIYHKRTMLAEDDDDLKRKAHELIPKQHHEHLDVFSKVQSDKLSPYRPGVDHNIDLTADPRSLGYSPLYKMSLEKMEACRKYIVNNLK